MRSAARVIGKVAFAVFALVFLAIGGIWVFAQSARGGDLIRRVALKQVNARIAGHLAIDRLRFGGNRVALGGVVLSDPAGGVVARVDGIDLRFALLALLHDRFQIDRLEIERPELRLVSSPRGSNLSRAIAPRTPKPAQPAPASQTSTGPGMVVDLRALALRDGDVSVRSGAPPIHVQALNVDGSVRYETGSQRLRTDLRVAATGARIEARGGLDLAAGRAAPDGFTVRIHDVNLADLMRDTPQSNLAVNLDAHGADASLDVRMRAPGLAVSGHATYDGTDVDARLAVDASDLSATARALARCHLSPPLELAGAGKIDLALRGPATRAQLTVAARLPRLAYQDYAVRDLKLSARVPRVDRVQELQLDLSAAAVKLAERRITGVEVALHVIGPHIAVNVRTASPYAVALTADGDRLTPHAVRVNALNLRYPGEAWTLAGRTKVLLDGDRIELSGLDLRGRGQRIRADLTKVGGRGRAQLAISHLDLGRLPRPLIPPAVAALGKIDVDADVRFSPSRLRGRVGARGIGTGVDADFDMPASWDARDSRQPLRLSLSTPETDLAALAKTIASVTGQPVPLAPRGRIALTANVDGSASDPRVAVKLHARGLAAAQQPIGDLDVSVDGRGERPIGVRVQASGAAGGVLAGPLSLTVATKESIRSLLRHRPTADTLTRLPFEAQLDVKHVALAPAGKLAKLPAPIEGTLALQARVHGTAESPEGTVSIDLSGVRSRKIPPTDGRVELTLGDRATQLNVRVLQAQHPLLALEARVEAGLQRLRDRAAWEQLPLRVRAVVGPLAMTHAGLPRPDQPDERRSQLHGQLHADLAIDGTLAAPRVLAHVQAGDLTLDKKPVGYAELELRYLNEEARIALTATSANGGNLTVGAGARINLGLPAVMAHPPDLQRLAFDLTVRAHELDLRGLSGLTAMLPRAGGLLNVDIQARGTARDPRFSGRVECVRCELELDGMGDFREIHLALHGDTDKVVLDELTAKSGAGHARVTGALSRNAGHTAYDLSGQIDATDMPVYQEGQPLATLSVGATLSGSTGGNQHATARVDISEAHVRLSDEKRKNLQSLKAPDDIVLVQDGQPVDRGQAKRLRALTDKLDRLRTTGAQAPGADKPAAAAPAPTPVGPWSSVTIYVNAPRKLWVAGHDASLELGLGPKFRVRVGSDVQIYGQVLVHRGRINAFGRRFDLKSDTTLEFGGPPDHPTLDATAQYQNDQENVTVLLTAKGPLEHLAIGVSSPNRPDLSQSQLYTLIITGHLQFGESSGSGGSTSSAAASEASGLIAGAIAGGLQKTLAKRLPLDVLTIDAGGAGLNGTQFEAGRYVTDRLYVGYVGRIGADPTRYQNKNAVHVEYQLTPRWQFAGEYGDVGTGSADLMWKKSY